MAPSEMSGLASNYFAFGMSWHRARISWATQDGVIGFGTTVTVEGRKVQVVSGQDNDPSGAGHVLNCPGHTSCSNIAA